MRRNFFKSAVDGFNPIEFSPMFWYDFNDTSLLFTDSGVTNVTTDGDLIQQVNDKSGNGYHIRQTATGDKPIYKTSIQNGLASGMFNGSTHAMNAIDQVTIFPQPSTYFIVHRYTLAVSGRVLIDGNSGSHRQSVQSSSPGYLLFAGAAPSFGTLTLNTRIMSVVFNGAASIGTLDGGAPVTGLNVGTLPLRGLGVGAFLTTIGEFPGYMFDIIGYNSLLSEEERNLVRNWLNDKWSAY